MQSTVTKKEGNKTKITGVKLTSGQVINCDLLLVCAGAWTPLLLPHLDATLVPVAQPVFHLQPRDMKVLSQYTPPNFPVYTADIEYTGFYGFPAHPHEKVLKIGHHGRGYPMRREIVNK
jgi:glycine/D-amino acid oxidase-like deaminating enzyme